MKLLHISDLHAGKTLGNITQVSRNADLIYALNQIEDICKKEKVSVLLIAGDIFDKKNPDYESLELIFDFLVRTNFLGLHTVLIAGNHDSYDLLKSYKSLNKLANIHIFDRVYTDLNKLVFELENLKVACLPYPSEKVLTSVGEESSREYTHKVQKFIQALAKHVDNAEYKILLSHLMIESAEIAGSEKQISVLDTYAVRPDSLPRTFHYVALGHVHKKQRIERATPQTYYSGSLYQIDFAEKGMPKFANLVILENGDLSVREIKLDLYKELKEFEIKDNESFSNFINYQIHEIGSAYVKVVYYMDPTDLEYSIKKEKIIKSLGDKLLRLEVRANVKGAMQNVDELKGNDIVSMYINYYKSNYGKAPSEDIINILRETIKGVEDEAHKA